MNINSTYPVLHYGLKLKTDVDQLYYYMLLEI